MPAERQVPRLAGGARGETARFSYTAYGLALSSYLELPELAPGEGGADVVVRRAGADLYGDALARGGAVLQPAGDGLLYTLEGAGSFLATGGRDIEVDPAPGVEPRVLRLPLLGPALALVLYQRGHLLLHASAVVVGGRAVLFVSRHNGGKSTMATAAAARGHRILSDDLTCVDLSDRAPRVLPGIAQVKLCPDAAEAFAPRSAELHPLHPGSPKLGLRSRQILASAAAPVWRAYFLEEGPDLDIRPVAPDRGLARLIAHGYGSRFGDAFLQVVDRGTLFLRHAELARALSFRALYRPRSLDLLPRVVAAVEDDVAAGPMREPSPRHSTV